MYMDSNLKLEVLSTLLGTNVKPYDGQRRKRFNVLSVDDFHLHNLTGKQQAYAEAFFIDHTRFFDPVYDYDFTNLSDSAQCLRGDEHYERPKGWYRIALKVRGTYPDGDTWLGPDGWRSHSAPGEWPVSYHGTSLDGAKGIIRSHYTTGNRCLYGRGIYSTPDIHVAEREEYAKTFTSVTTGKSYKVILQNRINPDNREICPRSDYWLIRVHSGASAKEEKQIVESSIRPYGILIKEIKDDDKRLLSSLLLESSDDESSNNESSDDKSSDGESSDDKSSDDQNSDIENGNDNENNDDDDTGLIGGIVHSLFSAVRSLFE